MGIYAIASQYKYEISRDKVHSHFEHEYVLVELQRIEDDLYWVPLEGQAARDFYHDTPLMSLDKIQAKYNYTYVGQLIGGRKPYQEKDLSRNPEL